LRNFAAPAKVLESSTSSWTARESVSNPADPQKTAIAKISVLPANVARTMKLVEHIANGQQVRWRALVYATGLGWLRLEGKVGALRSALQALRGELESQQGSLVALHHPEKMPSFDA